jgi:hypothetical protein
VSDNTVHVSLLVKTDKEPAALQLAILAALSDQHTIMSTSVLPLDGDDPPAPLVHAVVCPVRGLLRTFVDEPEAAEAFARDEGAVLMVWDNTEIDHRRPAG